MAIESFLRSANGTDGWVNGPSGGSLIDSSDTTYIEASTYRAVVNFSTSTISFSLSASELAKGVRFKLRAQKVGTQNAVLSVKFVPRNKDALSRELFLTVVDDTWADYYTPWIDSIIFGEDYIEQEETIETLDIIVTLLTGSAQVSEAQFDVDVWNAVTGVNIGGQSSNATNIHQAVFVSSRNYGEPEQYIVEVAIKATNSLGAADVWHTEVYVPFVGTGLNAVSVLSDYLNYNQTYYSFARVGKVGVAGSILWSSWSSANEIDTIGWEAVNPNDPNINFTLDDAQARVRLTWNWTGDPDFNYAYITIERSINGGEWKLVRGARRIEVGNPTGFNNGTIYDYEAPRGKTLTYRILVEAHVGFQAYYSFMGNLVEESPVTLDSDGEWWLKSVNNPSLNTIVEVEGTEADLEFATQSASFSPLGRDTFITLRDTARKANVTYTFGTLTEQEYEDLKALWESGDVLYLQSPNYDKIPDAYVSVDSPVKDKIVNFAQPYHRVTIPFVAAAMPIVEQEA